MNIAVIAANGRTGQAFVEVALATGHSVRAGVRGESHLPQHPNLTTIPCDATDPAQVMQLISGQDAVASFIGHVKGSPPDVQARATAVILQCMQTTGVRRIVSLTGTGVRFPGDHITLLDRILNLAISTIDPARVHDGQNHVGLLQQSTADWTVIRVLKLQDIAARPFSLTEHGPTKPYVSRTEAAQAALQVLTQHTFIRQAPIISSARQ